MESKTEVLPVIAEALKMIMVNIEKFIEIFPDKLFMYEVQKIALMETDHI